MAKKTIISPSLIPLDLIKEWSGKMLPLTHRLNSCFALWLPCRCPRKQQLHSVWHCMRHCFGEPPGASEAAYQAVCKAHVIRKCTDPGVYAKLTMQMCISHIYLLSSSFSLLSMLLKQAWITLLIVLNMMRGNAPCLCRNDWVYGFISVNDCPTHRKWCSANVVIISYQTSVTLYL